MVQWQKTGAAPGGAPAGKGADEEDRTDADDFRCGLSRKAGAGCPDGDLRGLPNRADRDLLVGYDSSDDACVYRVSDDTAVIQTVDFFTPIVDDPYTFGQIAAANALSDVYAMGGTPKLAMNLLCVPDCLFPT